MRFRDRGAWLPHLWFGSKHLPSSLLALSYAFVSPVSPSLVPAFSSSSSFSGGAAAGVVGGVGAAPVPSPLDEFFY